MSIARIELAKGFILGDDAVLLAMDGEGVIDVASALRSALQQGGWELEHSGFHHEFVIDAGQSGVVIDGLRIVWRLDEAKAAELVDALDGLVNHGRPGHRYIDISQPTDTLVLSRDEYVTQA